MHKIMLVILLLMPFMVWDAAVYMMRKAGDTSSGRRSEILRHFTEKDIELGREHVRRHNQLLPFSRLLFYAFYAVLLFGGLGVRLESWLLSPTGGRWYLALLLFVFLLLVARVLIYMPLSAYRERMRLRKTSASFNFSNEYSDPILTPGDITLLKAVPWTSTPVP